MNTEQKQRFLASYIGVDCAIKIGIENLLYRVNAFVLQNHEKYKLQLTHPSKITDAHCVELFDLLYSEIFKNHSNPTDEYKIESIKRILLRENWSVTINECEIIISFLRNNEYIFQFEGMSIEELVEEGVVELK